VRVLPPAFFQCCCYSFVVVVVVVVVVVLVVFDFLFSFFTVTSFLFFEGFGRDVAGSLSHHPAPGGTSKSKT